MSRLAESFCLTPPLLLFLSHLSFLFTFLQKKKKKMKLKPVSSYKAYLEEDRIENLRLYKYGAVDKSPISNYILKHYWDFAITLFPRWIA